MNDINKSVTVEEVLQSIKLVKIKARFLFLYSLILMSSTLFLFLYIRDYDKVKLLIYFTDKAIPVIITLFGFTLAVFSFTMHLVSDEMISAEISEFKGQIKQKTTTTSQIQIFTYYLSLILLLFYLVYVFTINIILVNSPNTFINLKPWFIDFLLFTTIFLFCFNMLLTAMIARITVIYAQVRILFKIFYISKNNFENKSDNPNTKEKK